MTHWSRLDEALQRQKEFSDLFFSPASLAEKQKEEMMKTLILSLHAEATGLVDAVNYKDHRLSLRHVDTQKILYKSVDVYRYILATLNLWGIDEREFSEALSQKDDYLHYRHALSMKKWQGQPVAIFDMDDVLAEFRVAFCEFVTNKSGFFIDPQNEEYYNISTFKAHGLSNEIYFRDFIADHGFLRLRVNEKYLSLMHHLKSAGYWIQILTARSDSNLRCFYDTFSWLARNQIPADSVAFATEKFSWLTHQEFYNESTQVFAIDDSAKHAAEYAKHSVPVLVPEKTYNKEVRGLSRITYIPFDSNPIDHLSNVTV